MTAFNDPFLSWPNLITLSVSFVKQSQGSFVRDINTCPWQLAESIAGKAYKVLLQESDFFANHLREFAKKMEVYDKFMGFYQIKLFIF